MLRRLFFLCVDVLMIVFQYHFKYIRLIWKYLLDRNCIVIFLRFVILQCGNKIYNHYHRFEFFKRCSPSFQMIRKMIAQKKKYFTSFWQVLDLIIGILSLFAIAFYAGRTIHANKAVSKITSDTHKGKWIISQFG